ncbi:hypothetical protein AQUCO_05000016v1 [Aquilegia coerulea]|uniref:Uncharacterized protein n=1 Tax=Aquilegia coerulea TaxID=218851 RepID=A0A2G5CJ87_AQUCA|nr:hypothetical protein AQUCO_05000016v1 [Aquilegia coerulea]PIA31346.1 hypothetical protein AQUCO_05000016v1 [Aquilegia coerulea]PIA31347.1 hypothetical protein AQUCO_05000016v1 [Aquilegia coerulea]
MDTSQLKCRLKDIYFPYIQCDEMLGTGRTTTPIQFQVNVDDLADLDGGEVAITNMLSCHGPDFVLQLHFLINQNDGPDFGKERINEILGSLKAEGFKVAETFDTFPRASIRRLGRLLPDARWGRLPFMEPRQRKGDRAQVLKRCSMRVKCFIDTDAGFNPTPYKTDLAHHHPCTEALKNFGNKLLEKKWMKSPDCLDTQKLVGSYSVVIVAINSLTYVRVEILRDGKPLSLSQLEKEYEEWLLQMHDKYDEEIVCGKDDPVVVFLSPHNKKGLGVSSDVVRVHKVIEKKGKTWKAGQQIKMSKGAAGWRNNNICFTLEYILVEGLEGDACGEARLICRPLHVPEEKGSLLRISDVNASLDIQSSISFPISVIDSGKCNIMEAAELEKQLYRLHQKAPSTIDILSLQDCRQLEIDEALTFDAPVYAGNVTLKKIIAVVRPVSYTSPSSFRSVDQKFIIKDDLGMSMEVTYIGKDDGGCDGEFIFGQRINSSKHGGIQGLYVFVVGSTDLKHFQKSGIYKFLFTIVNSSSKKCEKILTVLPDTQVYQWKLLSNEKVGSYLPRVSIACLDRYGNRMSFMSTPEVVVKIESLESAIDPVPRMKVDDIWIESRNLDIIRPHFEASLVICSQDTLCCVRVPCQVLPGVLCQVRLVNLQVPEHVLPGAVINELVLEVFLNLDLAIVFYSFVVCILMPRKAKDRFGNHIERGVSVCINVDGLGFQDQKGLTREVDDNGHINLSGILKVKAGYGKIVSLSVNNGEETYFMKEFLVEKRMLKIGSMIPQCCPVGSRLEDIIFEVVDSDGTVDQTIHDTKFGKHTLKLTSEHQGLQDSLQYSFSNGRCTVPSILVPEEEGICFLVASHSCYPELSTNFQIRVMQPPEMQRGSLFVHEANEPSLHSDGGMLLLQDSSACLSVDEQAFIGSFASGTQELHTEISRTGMKIMEHEKTLKLLCEKMATIDQDIRSSKALIGPQEISQLSNFINDKEAMVRRIEGKGTKAASVICNMMKVAHSQGLQDQWFEGIIGVVALLGTVSNNNLSRIFAEHLGEKNMLAVVCKSYETARTLEKYEEPGKVDLYAIAAELGQSINGRFM